jgi:hypothetical protein
MQFSIAVLYTHTERLTAFGEDVDGNLYVTDGAGYVYRIVVL